MRTFPVADPGTPDLRSPGRYLLWVARMQWTTVAAGMLWGIVWMVAQAVGPAVLGRAIDDGVRARDRGALLTWVGVLLGLGVIQAFSGVMRHRCAVANWLAAVHRTQQIVLRHAVRLGGSLPARVPAGEAANVSATDAVSVGRALDITARGAGAVVAVFIVAVLLLATSVPLGLLVLIGVPALVLGVGPLLRPLHRRQQLQRRRLAEASTLAADTVSGLRILRGVGGEETFGRRYRAASQEVRRAGVRVARVEALLDALQVLLPGALVVIVTVVGARLALAGDITPGQLVAFYGYAAFLVTPLRTGTEFADKGTRSLVAAGRILELLRLQPARREPASPAPEPPRGSCLHDPVSGVVIEPGLLTAVAADDPAVASALADRLGGYQDSEASLGGTPLRDLPTAMLRRRVLVSDAAPALLRGRLRDELDPTGTATDMTLAAAVRTASAGDVVDSLKDGLDTELEERARELSGGQRQRLVLVRALLADADVLVLDEPTSAVDAHTEERIGERLRAHRRGRTTVVFTTSPLLLRRADVVMILRSGRLAASGSHEDLLGEAAYRAVVSRDEAS